MINEDLIKKLPKTDLHVHLDGSLRVSTLLELARARNVALPSDTVDGLNELVFKPTYASLEEYLHGFAFTCAVLTDAEALERSAYELAWDNINEGVRYIEVRFAPHLHMRDGFTFDDVMRAVNGGLDRARREYAASPAVAELGEPPFNYGIIVCAMRFFTGAFSPWFARLCSLLRDAPERQVFSMASLELARAAVRARNDLGIPIVGFDLAGREDGYPAHHHRDAYAYVHRHFMKKTVHAGEAYGAESIFDAITELHADRLGHGYHLFSAHHVGPHITDPEAYVGRLARYIADRRITIEVCITSNLQTNPDIRRIENHVFGRMLTERMSATLCTDNRLVSHTTVTGEISAAVKGFGMDLNQLRNTIIYGFKRSFYPGRYTEKRQYVRSIIDHYDRVLAEAGLPPAPSA